MVLVVVMVMLSGWGWVGERGWACGWGDCVCIYMYVVCVHMWCGICGFFVCVSVCVCVCGKTKLTFSLPQRSVLLANTLT